MAEAFGRLVGRVHRLLQPKEPGSASGQLPSRDMAELQARVRRLRDLDHRYTHAGLSRCVTCGCVNGAEIRVGGECVARDV